MDNKIKSKSAFTLAEVLITLVIIGVVAALTIPNLINKTNKEELRTGLLKAQTTLSDALKLYYSHNGYKLISGDLEQRGLYEKIKPYFSIAKDCGYNNCIAPPNVYYRNFTDTADIPTNNFDDGQFILNNGMAVFIEDYMYRYISVDVNGYEKKPNRAGYDLFLFQIDADGNLLPMGADGTLHSASGYCSSSSNNSLNGFGCTAKALKDANYFKNLP